MVFTVRAGRCKSSPHSDNAIVFQNYPEKSSQTKLVKSNSIRSQQFLNHVGLYHYKHWPELQNTTFFTYFFSEKHTHCVVLTQTFDDTTSTWVLYEGGADESVGRDAFDRINRTLAPLLYEGAVVLTEDLLDAIITPEPVPPEDVPDIVLEMVEINPSGHPEWPLVVKALVLAEEMSQSDSVVSNGTPPSPTPPKPPGKPSKLERLTSIASIMATDSSNDDVFYSLKSPSSEVVSEVVDLHDAAKGDKSEFIRKAMVRKATQSSLYGDDNTLECGTAERTSLSLIEETESEFGSVDFNLVDRISQDTPLYSSVEKGYIKSSLYFLLGGANPNFVHPESGDTCLHLAARQALPNMVKLLVSFNADPSLRNNSGQTPQDVLQDSTDQGMAIQSLLEEVAELRSRNEALHCEPITTDSLRGSEGVKGQYLLSFDGGGSRCVTAMQTLIAVERHMHKIYPDCKPLISHFDYVAGTSGGAFLSTMLVYNRNTLENARALNVNGATFLSPSSIYDKSKMVEKLIKSTLGSDRVMADVTHPRCILTATLANTIPPKLHLLTNYGEPRNNQPGPNEQTIWEAARMSSAAPTYLLSYKNTIDGGVMANNPTVDALVEMNEQAKKETGKPLRLGCCLSVGCGVERPVNVENIDVSGYSFGIKGLASKVDGYKNLISLMISSVTQTEGQDLSRARTLCDLSGGVYYRLTPPVDQAIPLDTCNPVELIQPIFDSFMYTLRNPELIDSVARTLISKSNLY